MICPTILVRQWVCGKRSSAATRPLPKSHAMQQSGAIQRTRFTVVHHMRTIC
jgi:hypothetical protein